MTNIGILLANKMLWAPVPKGVLRLVEQDQPSFRLARMAFDRIYSGIPLGLISNQFHMFLSNDNLLDRLRYFRWVALTPRPTDGQFLRLPDRLAFLYYIVRPLRLFITYILKCGKEGKDISGVPKTLPPRDLRHRPLPIIRFGTKEKHGNN
jgi:hypothetical protein